MPRLSIVIPCLGGPAEFDGTLVSVLQYRPADCEVVVVHTQPYDDPYGLADEVDFHRQFASGLPALINAGLAHSRGEIVHVLGCGLEAIDGWTDAAVAHFADADVASVSPLVLAGDRQSIVSAGVRFSRGGVRKLVADRRLLSPGAGRLRASLHGPSLVAAFYRREALAALDGFDESLGEELADADAALALRELGYLHVCEPAARLIQTRGSNAAAGPTGFAHGRAAERLFWRHAASRGLALSLALHGGALAARLLSRRESLASLAGRAMAWLEMGSVRRCQQRLTDAQQRLAELAALRATIKLPQRASAMPARRAA
jgi:hypothetical protein